MKIADILLKVLEDMETQTDRFLLHDEPISDLTISFGETTIVIPMDMAEYNGEAQCFIDNLIDIAKDYEE